MKHLSLVSVVFVIFASAAFAQSSSSDSSSNSLSSAPTAQHSALSALPVAPTPVKHFDLYLGPAYSSANQVKSSSPLIGGVTALDMKLKPWFGGTVDLGYYALGHGLVQPTMYTMLAGPAFFLNQDRYEVFFHALFGLAHIGNANMTPNLAYAYGVGVGLQYDLNKRFAVRASGDGIFSAFALNPNNLGNSQDLRVNSRATGGIVYHF